MIYSILPIDVNITEVYHLEWFVPLGDKLLRCSGRWLRKRNRESGHGWLLTQSKSR